MQHLIQTNVPLTTVKTWDGTYSARAHVTIYVLVTVLLAVLKRLIMERFMSTARFEMTGDCAVLLTVLYCTSVGVTTAALFGIMVI